MEKDESTVIEADFIEVGSTVYDKITDTLTDGRGNLYVSVKAICENDGLKKTTVHAIINNSPDQFNGHILMRGTKRYLDEYARMLVQRQKEPSKPTLEQRYIDVLEENKKLSERLKTSLESELAKQVEITRLIEQNTVSLSEIRRLQGEVVSLKNQIELKNPNDREDNDAENNAQESKSQDIEPEKNTEMPLTSTESSVERQNEDESTFTYAIKKMSLISFLKAKYGRSKK